jgi:hypothetical protein
LEEDEREDVSWPGLSPPSLYKVSGQ